MRAHTMSYLTRDTCPQLESVDDLPLVQPVPDTLHGAYDVYLSNYMPKTIYPSKGRGCCRVGPHVRMNMPVKCKLCASRKQTVLVWKYCMSAHIRQAYGGPNCWQL